MTGMGRNAGAENGRDDAGGAPATATAPGVEVATAAADDDADTNGGESTIIDDGEHPSAATAGPCDG